MRRAGWKAVSLVIAILLWLWVVVFPKIAP